MIKEQGEEDMTKRRACRKIKQACDMVAAIGGITNALARSDTAITPSKPAGRATARA